jgi:hypothetical protein
MSEQTPPLSRPLTLGEVPAKGRDIALSTSEDERRGVAALLRIPGVSELTSVLHVERFGPDGLSVTGEIHAHISQICVVTSETFDSDIVAPVDIRFSPDGVDPNSDIALADLADPDAEDPPDRMVGGRIDLGTVVTEFLALALDPYPRKPGVEFSGEAADPDVASPFAALSRLKDKP